MTFKIGTNSTLPPRMIRYIRLVEANNKLYEAWKKREQLSDLERRATRDFLGSTLRARADRLELVSKIERASYPTHDVQREDARIDHIECKSLSPSLTSSELRALADAVEQNDLDDLTEDTFLSLDRVVADVSHEVFRRVDRFIAS